MRSTLPVLVLLAVAALAHAAPLLLEEHGPVAGSVALIAIGVAFACAASESRSTTAIACGALGAWLASVVGAGSPAAGGATLLVAVYADRIARARGMAPRVAQALLAIVAGALGAAVAEAHASSSIAIRLVAVGVASVLATLPRLVDSDDAVAHALDAIAARVPEPARSNLARGADLRRSSRDVPFGARSAHDELTASAPPRVARDAAARVRRTWRSLVTLAEARLRLERARLSSTAPPAAPISEPSTRATRPADAVIAMVERRIAEHVSALTRAYEAADSARAAELGLDDVDLRGTETVGDALEDVRDALVDLQS